MNVSIAVPEQLSGIRISHSRIADTKETESFSSFIAVTAAQKSSTGFTWGMTMKIAIVVIAILSLLVCYASFVVARRADEWSENEWKDD